MLCYFMSSSVNYVYNPVILHCDIQNMLHTGKYVLYQATHMDTKHYRGTTSN